MAPVPVIPHTRVFTTGGSRCTPRTPAAPLAACVYGQGHADGSNHPLYRIAWVTLNYLREVTDSEVSRLSIMPMVSLARVLADKGATTQMSAHFLSSNWRTGSPLSVLNTTRTCDICKAWSCETYQLSHSSRSISTLFPPHPAQAESDCCARTPPATVLGPDPIHQLRYLDSGPTPRAADQNIYHMNTISSAT
jgi:hypothetical protein